LQDYAKEVHYKTNESEFYGIGIKNLSGGYDVRNSIMKAKIGKNDISVLEIEKGAPIVVVEGMIDAFSILELQKRKGKVNNVVVLNSTVNTDRFIERYRDCKDRIYLCLDGDEGGNNATNKIINALDNHRVKDIRYGYGINPELHNDLNEYLVNEKNKQKMIPLSRGEFKESFYDELIKLGWKESELSDNKEKENVENSVRSEATPDFKRMGGREITQEISNLSDLGKSRERDSGGGSAVGSDNARDGFKTSDVSSQGGRGIEGTQGGTQETLKELRKQNVDPIKISAIKKEESTNNYRRIGR